ncbi:MAG TPA: pilus assembly protein N-terminal domain-containing protein [Bryobacteraceae bacterium]|jgi:pilus assembly protein CpaC
MKQQNKTEASATIAARAIRSVPNQPARHSIARRSLRIARAIGAAAVLFAAAGVLVPAAKADGAAEDLRLTVGKSVVIDYASDIRQISTSNPEIADASPITTREVILQGKGLGSATLIVWNKEGQRYFYNVTVEMSLESLRRLMKETFPKDTIQIQSSKDSVSLTGVVSSPATSERAAAMAAGFARTVINNLTVNTTVSQQIVLRVRFAELSRTKANQFGVNILSTAFGQSTSLTTGQIGAPSVGGSIGSAASGAVGPLFTITQALNIFAFRPGLNMGAFISALQTKGILQILSEPNLVTSNGKEASFIVGGEVPVPVLQGGSNASSVTVQFKEYGIRLKFLPTVTTNKTIKLDLMQEVSDIDVAHGVAFNGFVIPALTTRRANTSIELADHQSFLVAGMLDNRDTESMSKLPGISSIPVLGQLFKSNNVSKGLDELVMVVTPEITLPMNQNDLKPMPDFPNEFLVPLSPIAPPPAIKGATGSADAKRSPAANREARQAAKEAKLEARQEAKQKAQTAKDAKSAKQSKDAKDQQAKAKKADTAAVRKADPADKGESGN